MRPSHAPKKALGPATTANGEKSDISHVDKLRALRAESRDKVYFGALHEAQNRRLFQKQGSDKRAVARAEADAARKNLEAREKREAESWAEQSVPLAAAGAPLDGSSLSVEDGAASPRQPPPPPPPLAMEEVEAGQAKMKPPPLLGARKAMRKDERVHGLAVRLLPFDVVQEQIRTILIERWLLRDFVLHVPFLAIFMIFFIGRRNFSEEFFAIDAAYKALAREPLPPTHPFTHANNSFPYYMKPFEEIGNEDDTYDFLEAIAIPKLFQGVPASGLQPQDVRIFDGNTVPLGSYRLRWKHVRDGTCSPNPQWYPSNRTLFPMECYGEYSDGNEMREPYPAADNGPPILWQECDNDILRIQGRFTSYGCGAYMMEIPVNTNATAAYKMVNRARTARLSKTLTLRFASIDFIGYSISARSFLYVRLAVEVAPGGGYMPWNYIRTFRGGGGSIGWLLVDVLFGLMVIFAVYRQIEDFRKNAELTKKPFSYFADAWNVMSLINTTMFCISLLTHYTWIGLSLTTGALFGPDKTEADLIAYPTRLALLEEFSKFTLYFNSVNAVLSTIVLLKFARTNQRLNILQRTVAGSIGHLLSVLIIFAIIVIAYGVAGNMLFGRMLGDYRTVTDAIVTNFRSLLGNFRYWDLFLTNRFLAFAYFWSFVVLGLFIMLNFIVAILMRGFEEEANKTRRVGVAQALAKSASGFGRAWRNLKITLMNILKGRETPESMLFTGMKSMAADFQDRGDVDFSQLFIGRDEFTGSIPPVDVALYGDAYFDELWLGFLAELDLRRRAKSDKTLSTVSAQVYEAARDAAVDVLFRYHSQIYGIADKVEDHVIQAVEAELDLSRQIRKADGPLSWELMEEVDAARAAFDSEDQRRDMHTLYSARTGMGCKSWPYVLRTLPGKRQIRARNIGEVVNHIQRRAAALFTLYDDGMTLPEFERNMSETVRFAEGDHPPIWPEGEGVLRDMRTLLNDVFGEIEEFKDSDVYQRWLNGDRSFEEEKDGGFGSGRGFDDRDGDGYDRGYGDEELEISSRGGGFREVGNGTAAFGNATSSHRRSSGGTGPPGAAGTASNTSRAPFADLLADDDSGWQSAAPYGGGGGSQASRQRF